MGRLSAAAKVARERWAPDTDPNAGTVHRAAQSATVISVVVIGVVALIGILIFDQVRESIPQSALEDDSGNLTNLGNSTESIMTGFGNAMELVPIVLLVLIAAVVIAVVQRMRGGEMR